MSEPVRIRSARFGEIEAQAAELIEFPGLPGFPAARRFLVRRHDQGDGLGWLLCADDPELAFVVASPWTFVPDYAPEVAPRWLRALGAERAEELEWLALATVDETGVALNLAAPLLIHPRTRRGMQVILDGDYPLRERVLPPPQIESKPQK
ncbi:MAG TPA: flagellar assembly protein FliW [Myxococcota bacterium]